MSMVLSYLNILSPCFFLIGLCWLSYWDSLKNQYTSDDLDPGGGISIHDGLFHVKGWPFKNKCPNCQLPVTDLQKPPCPKTTSLGWGILFKQFRWYLGKVPNSGYNKSVNPADPNAPKDMRYWIAHSMKHHRFNIMVFSGLSVSLYCLLASILGEKLAFFTVALFIVHPSAVLPVGWVSGIGYVVGLFFASMGLNLSVLFQNGVMTTPLKTIGCLLLYAFFQYLAVNAMFATWGVVFILALLKLWSFALVAGIIGVYSCFRTLREAVGYRQKTFEEQQMGYSTKFHLRKLIVMPKTIAYYTKLAFFPKRLGLYHKYGYHYEMPHIELEDKYFWCGILLLILFTVGLIFGSFPIKLAITIYLSFLVLFMNWIVVHQFVSERYVWMPSLGVCLFFAYITQNHLAVYWAVFGVALMRTWTHLPSYYDEINFYDSNIWNFPDSEVAYGNKGVVQLKKGMSISAIDTWLQGTRINPDYDVNWYNLYSVYKTSQNLILQYGFGNPMEAAKTFLERAIASKTCHFPKQWQTELGQLNEELGYQKKFAEMNQYLMQIKNIPEKQEEAKNLEQAMMNVQNMRKLIEEEKKNQNAVLVSKLQELNNQKVGIEFQMQQGEGQRKAIEGINVEQNSMLQQRIAIDNLYNAMQKKRSETANPQPNNPV